MLLNLNLHRGLVLRSLGLEMGLVLVILLLVRFHLGLDLGLMLRLMIVLKLCLSDVELNCLELVLAPCCHHLGRHWNLGL